MTSSGAGKSGDAWFCSCWIDEDCGWVYSCRLVAQTLAAADIASVSDSDPDPDPDLGPVVFVAQPAFWAAVILPRLFSKATALVN